MKKAASDRVEELREQLKRLYDPLQLEKALFQGVPTNPPLSLCIIKTRETMVAKIVDDLIDKNSCVDKESLYLSPFFVEGVF